MAPLRDISITAFAVPPRRRSVLGSGCACASHVRCHRPSAPACSTVASLSALHGGLTPATTNAPVLLWGRAATYLDVSVQGTTPRGRGQDHSSRRASISPCQLCQQPCLLLLCAQPRVRDRSHCHSMPADMLCLAFPERFCASVLLLHTSTACATCAKLTRCCGIRLSKRSSALLRPLARLQSGSGGGRTVACLPQQPVRVRRQV